MNQRINGRLCPDSGATQIQGQHGFRYVRLEAFRGRPKGVSTDKSNGEGCGILGLTYIPLWSRRIDMIISYTISPHTDDSGARWRLQFVNIRLEITCGWALLNDLWLDIAQ